jgi:hypothetical protein
LKIGCLLFAPKIYRGFNPYFGQVLVAIKRLLRKETSKESLKELNIKED